MNISELINNPKKLEEVFKKVVEEEDEETANLLVDFIDNPNLIVWYATDIVGGRVKEELEDKISKSPSASYYYAERVIEGPWPKGEDVIAQDAEYSYYYANYILDGPFPKGEDVIAKDTEYSYYYATTILKGPFIKGEKAIIKEEKFLNKYLELLKRIGELDNFYKRHPELKSNKEV